MKIQDLAIIFIIIIVPISIVLSYYTQFQIQTLNIQTLYDAKLTSATYDAIKAFQINSANSTLSDIAGSKIRDIEASVETFKNSIMSTFRLNGYTEEEMNSYIPALVYTMYDGLYIYSPFENTNYLYEAKTDADGNVEKDSNGKIQYKTDVNGEKIPIDNNGETLYGLKPYITYSCRYKRGSIIDVIITYSLDNYITVQGMINSKYVNEEGYLIDNIHEINESTIQYNDVIIGPETNLKEYVGNQVYSYIKYNGTKYYYDDFNNEIFYISNGRRVVQYKENQTGYSDFVSKIQTNTMAYEYYKNAKKMTDYVEDELGSLKCSDAIDEEGNSIWPNDNRKIFEDDNHQIENDLSTFNQHRLEVIRHTIESNLSVVIANYQNYSHATSIEFQMPELKEEEWDLITDNIAMISFVQGLYIGGKIYNGYTIVTNSESQEVVQEENIYILGYDGNKKFYYRIGDKTLEDHSNYIVTTYPAGRINLDFTRKTLNTNSTTTYYYPLKDYYASYTSVVTRNNVTRYDDIYAYIDGQSDELKKAFYTALGRERQGMYKALRTDLLN